MYPHHHPSSDFAPFFPPTPHSFHSFIHGVPFQTSDTMNEDLASHPTTVVVVNRRRRIVPLPSRTCVYRIRACVACDETVCIPNPFFERSRGGHSSTCDAASDGCRESRRELSMDSTRSTRSTRGKKKRGNHRSVDRGETENPSIGEIEIEIEIEIAYPGVRGTRREDLTSWMGVSSFTIWYLRVTTRVFSIGVDDRW